VDEFLQSQVVNCFGKAPEAPVVSGGDAADTDAKSKSAYSQVKNKADDHKEGDVEMGVNRKKVPQAASTSEPPPVPEDVQNAGRLSHAHDFVSAFPEGYNTDVGEGSIMVSGGQKQRIAIARAIVKDPHILLLDEATSALDAASERLVQESIDSLQALQTHTSIVIAHRLTTIKSADTIVVMDRGEVVESGTHEELLQLNQLYGKLWNRQQGGRDESSGGSSEAVRLFLRVIN
jgi:ABC-type glutathione transport system ATPase component